MPERDARSPSIWRLVALGLTVVVLDFLHGRLFPRLGFWTAVGLGLAAVFAVLVGSRLFEVRGADIRWGMLVLLGACAAYGTWILLVRHTHDGAISGSGLLVGLARHLLWWVAAKTPLVAISGAFLGPAVMRLARRVPTREAVLRAAGAGAVIAVAGPLVSALGMTLLPPSVPSGYTTPNPWSTAILFASFRRFALLYPAGFAGFAWLASRRVAGDSETRRAGRTVSRTSLARLAFGLLLVVASAYPLVRSAREWSLSRQVHLRYQLNREYLAYSAAFHEIGISIIDSLDPARYGPDDRVMAPVRISIGGRDHSVDTPVEIRPAYTDGNRYHLWISLGRLVDRSTGVERYAIVQRLDTAPRREPGRPFRHGAGYRFRALWIDPEGKVGAEQFESGDGSPPSYREILASTALPGPLDGPQMLAWPGLSLPIYPLGTALLGVAAVMGRKSFRASPAGGRAQ